MLEECGMTCFYGKGRKYFFPTFLGEKLFPPLRLSRLLCDISRQMREKASNPVSAQWVCDPELEALKSLPMVESSRLAPTDRRVASQDKLTPKYKKTACFITSYPARYGDDSGIRGNPGNGLLLDAAINAYVPVA